jgi:hypothetical protein
MDVLPLKNVTVPSGASPPPFVLMVTDNVMFVVELTPAPGLTVIVELVEPLITLRFTGDDILDLKLESPPY